MRLVVVFSGALLGLLVGKETGPKGRGPGGSAPLGR